MRFPDREIAEITRQGKPESVRAPGGVHVGHLDRPVMGNDAARANVWAAGFEPYGRVGVETQNLGLSGRGSGWKAGWRTIGVGITILQKTAAPPTDWHGVKGTYKSAHFETRQHIEPAIQFADRRKKEKWKSTKKFCCCEMF